VVKRVSRGGYDFINMECLAANIDRADHGDEAMA
jgi:hypothetical protein